jgi:uncharacterized membrane protein
MLDVLINSAKDKIPPKGIIKVSDRADKPVKSFLKSVSWRIVGTLDTMLISFFITGRISVALSIGSIEVITKTILYYFHERLWAHIHSIKLKGWFKTNGKQYEVRRAKQAARG